MFAALADYHHVRVIIWFVCNAEEVDGGEITGTNGAPNAGEVTDFVKSISWFISTGIVHYNNKYLLKQIPVIGSVTGINVGRSGRWWGRELGTPGPFFCLFF